MDNELMERYELYRDLKDEFEKVYRYKWFTTAWEGTIKWHESTDALSTIIYKQKEHWIDNFILIEEV
jgi:hypothetical protein